VQGGMGGGGEGSGACGTCPIGAGGGERGVGTGRVRPVMARIDGGQGRSAPAYTSLQIVGSKLTASIQQRTGGAAGRVVFN